GVMIMKEPLVGTAAPGKMGARRHSSGARRLEARALVIEAHAGLSAQAIVGVGLAVAAANLELRPGDMRAESRHLGAGAGDVGDEALSRASLAEQARPAFIGMDDEPVALLADADHGGGGWTRGHQRERADAENTSKSPCLHGSLPLCVIEITLATK